MNLIVETGKRYSCSAERLQLSSCSAIGWVLATLKQNNMNFQILQNGTIVNRFESESVDAAIIHFREMALDKATLVGPYGYFINIENPAESEVLIRRICRLPGHANLWLR